MKRSRDTDTQNRVLKYRFAVLIVGSMVLLRNVSVKSILQALINL